MNLQKVIALTIFGLSLSACSESQQPTSDKQEPIQDGDNKTEEKPSALQVACEASHGTIVGTGDNERCKCYAEICDVGVVCNFSNGKCTSSISGKCTGKEEYCNNGKIYECVDNSWSYKEVCSAGFGCVPDNSKCAECNNNSCSNGKLKSCLDGLYTEPDFCVSNACADEFTCAPECTGDEIVCKDSQLFQCQYEKLVPTKICEAGCDPNNKNSCAKKCVDGATICVDGQIKTCSQSEYSGEQPCENNYSCTADGKTCGICKNGKKRCVNDETTAIGHMEICNNGVYEYLEEDKECDNNNSCAKDGKTCGVCNNIRNDIICRNQPSAGWSEVGFKYYCKNGGWDEESAEECFKDKYVRLSCNQEKTDCGECLNGNTPCFVNQNCPNGCLVGCENGKYSDIVKICEIGCADWNWASSCK